AIVSPMASLWTRAGLSWRQLGLRLWRQIWEDELLGRCAELAYFFLFSIFPLLLFMTTLLGYVAEANPRLQDSLFHWMARVTPSRDVTALLNHTLMEIRAARNGTRLYLSLGAAVWVASNGMLAVSRTLNTACGLKESRPWWRRRIMAIALTLGFSVLIVAALFLIFEGAAIGEAMADRMGISIVFAVVWHFLRWPLILVFVALSFEMVYNFAPNLGAQERQWGSPGAVTGVSLWLLASFGLRLYLAYFHSYTTAYGSLGAVILLLVWFYLTAFAILMGGEVNSEIARELALQSGEERPRLSRRRRMLQRMRRRRRAAP
ncbi:MAG TPA: YihY/virulence factor BrkB family protein, partial [Thermoanaerobaculia bacterium]